MSHLRWLWGVLPAVNISGHTRYLSLSQQGVLPTQVTPISDGALDGATTNLFLALNSYATTETGLQSKGSYLHSQGPEALKPSALQWQPCLEDKIKRCLFV